VTLSDLEATVRVISDLERLSRSFTYCKSSCGIFCIVVQDFNGRRHMSHGPCETAEPLVLDV